MHDESGRIHQKGYDPGVIRQLRHDVRSPLNAVMGIAALIETWKPLNPQQQKIVEVLQSSTKDLHRNLDALFDYISPPERKVPDEAPSAPARAPSSRRVLLAEDYQPNALIAQTFLEDLGYEVDIAQDGEEAVARFRDGGYSAVLLDVQMPELDGLEAAKRMRELEAGLNRGRTPIIALTAHATRDDALFCKRAGMDDYLSKPFNAAQLSEKLRGVGMA
jgi:CheY-like chemotaxis protein